MTYKVGTRVKKVRGLYNVGCTGIVVGHLDNDLLNDIEIKFDQESIIYHRRTGVVRSVAPAGSVGPCESAEWKPILLDGLEAGDMSYEELIDSLKETVT